MVANDRRMIEDYLPIEPIRKEVGRYYDILVEAIVAAAIEREKGEVE